jgi:hypothetical protein
VYSPYKLYGLDKPGLKIGVVGLGGLVSVSCEKCGCVCVERGGTSSQPAQQAIQAVAVSGASQCP